MFLLQPNLGVPTSSRYLPSPTQSTYTQGYGHPHRDQHPGGARLPRQHRRGPSQTRGLGQRGPDAAQRVPQAGQAARVALSAHPRGLDVRNANHALPARPGGPGRVGGLAARRGRGRGRGRERGGGLVVRGVGAVFDAVRCGFAA